MSSRIVMVIFLALIWCGFGNDFSLANIGFGLILAALCHLGLSQHTASSRIRPLALLNLIGFTIIQLILSSVEVAWDILTPSSKSSPKIIKVPIRCQSPGEKLLLTNLLSLTPGTLSVTLTEQEDALYVHAMFAHDEARVSAFIQHKLEPKVRKVFGHV